MLETTGEKKCCHVLLLSTTSCFISKVSLHVQVICQVEYQGYYSCMKLMLAEIKNTDLLVTLYNMFQYINIT